ncbi:TPA: iron chelate uptake ABC transporter family permease subunit [Vibrio cholerae]|nr:iron chelate uptake ABC transporter family permease subunit [Vibrio cholerae]
MSGSVIGWPITAHWLRWPEHCSQRAPSQLLLAALVGGTLMLWADWLGQALLFPAQIAAGTLVAIIGGSYFLLLLLSQRAR